MVNRKPFHLEMYLLSEPGWKYKVKLNTTCRDQTAFKREDKSAVSEPIEIEFPFDWAQLVKESDEPLQIIYYYPVDRLANDLKEKLPSVHAAIYVADPEYEEYKKKHFFVLPKSITVTHCDKPTIEKLITLLGKNKIHPERPKNCIIIGGKTMLMQDASSEGRLSISTLIIDKKRIEDILNCLPKNSD
jgi:hypothetical protein